MHLPRAESAGRLSGLLLLRSAAVREGGGRLRERVLRRLGGGVLPPRPLVAGGASWSPQPPAPTTRTASGCSLSLFGILICHLFLGNNIAPILFMLLRQTNMIFFSSVNSWSKLQLVNTQFASLSDQPHVLLPDALKTCACLLKECR
jgi:hypothetical protein